MKHFATVMCMAFAATAFASAGDAYAFDWMSFGRWTVLVICGMALAAPLVTGLRRLARLAVPALFAFLLLGLGIFATTPNGGVPTREEKERLRAELAAAEAERAALGSLLTGGTRSGDATNDVPAFAFNMVGKETNRVDLASEWTPEYVFCAIGLYYSRWIESNDWARIDLRTDVSGETNCAWTITDPTIVTNNAAFFDARGFLADDDSDADGVVAQREVALGLDPDLADSDGDLLTDGEELGFAEVLPEDDFLWLDIPHFMNYITGGSDASNYAYLDADLGVPVTMNGTVYRSIHATLDGHVYLAQQTGVGPFAVDWCDPSQGVAFGLSSLAEGCVSVFGCNADMGARKTTWGSGLYFDTVSTNGVMYDVVEFRNIGLFSDIGSGSPALTYEVIFPREETNTVYVSYLSVDPSLAAMDMPLGVQCDGERDFGDTNRYYTVRGPAPAAGRTVRYRIGTCTSPLVADYDDYGIPLGYPRVSTFDADGDGLVDPLDPEPINYGGDFHGQSDAWVQATFTNAAEILSVGYPQWVDSQVGVGLTNGLYMLTITVPEVPSEATLLSVGEYSISVTNTGEYVFLLRKCIDYPLSVFPDDATNIVCSAVDDIVPSQVMLGMAGMNDGWWTTDRQGLTLVPPMYPMTLFTPRSHVLWIPTLAVSPSTWQPSSLSDTETFTAIVGEIPPGVASAVYRWNSSDSDVVSMATPALPTTQMTAHYPEADMRQVSLSLEVTIGDCTLHSYYVHSPNEDDTAPSFTLSAPDVLFINDDDDDGNGIVDAMAPFLDDDDIVKGDILFHSPVSANGTIVFEGVYGYDEGFDERPLVYCDASCTMAIAPGSEYPVNSRTDWSMPLYFNPATVSASHPGVQIRARWRPEEGTEVTASKRLTIVSPVAEPICNATTNVVEDGVGHCYAVNPCGVAVGREAYFRVAVAPEELPDSEIVWAKSPGLEFVGPGTGRRVTVRGYAPGYESLEVHVGGRSYHAPKFQVRVVEPVTVDLRAWIISNKAVIPISPEDVRKMVKDANDIYAQVGVTLNLVDPVVVTNIPDAYDALYWTPDNATPQWSYSRIVDIATNTCGLECYFINAFVDDRKVLAANGHRGAVITRGADFKDFAHEIGHEFGMHDIYKDSRSARDPALPLIELSPGEAVNYSHAQFDWNGGCEGSGPGGARYYAGNTKMVNILSRMLMNGTRTPADNPIDITTGDIYGVYYTNDVSNAEVWIKGNAPVLFPFAHRNISHR